MSTPTAVTLRLPATSANLGPGFDALALAMDFALHVTAEFAVKDRIVAGGRDAHRISDPAESLVLSTYREVMIANGREVLPLALTLHNEIPLGMGCGSSAAALVAGVALANHFGELGWSRRQVLQEASEREGHPDNVAACVLGGFTASAMRGGEVDAISFQTKADWSLLLVLPASGLPTKTARALLPAVYEKADAIQNVQNVALLTAAFATANEDVLQAAMADRMHQPYREQVCPLLPALLPLAGKDGILGVALSGAGPSVLLVVSVKADHPTVERLVSANLGQAEPAELLWSRIGEQAILSTS